MRRDWSIVTKARNGTVSIIRDLTIDECRKTYEALDPWYGHWIPPGNSTNSYRLCDDSDIVMREVIGPSDWGNAEVRDWDVWPKTLDKQGE